MANNRFSKPVAFNHTNEKDQLILKHVKRRNFSGYVKKLILADIEAKKGVKIEGEPVEDVKKEVDNDEVKIFIPSKSKTVSKE